MSSSLRHTRNHRLVFVPPDLPAPSAVAVAVALLALLPLDCCAAGPSLTVAHSSPPLLPTSARPPPPLDSIHRSKFFRDFCMCAKVNEFISSIAGTPLASHPMSVQQGHVNLK